MKTLKERIISEMMVNNYELERHNKSWWIIKNKFELIADVYSRKNAEKICTLLKLEDTRSKMFG